MRGKLTKVLVTLMAGVLASSCVEPIIMDPLEEMPVVVNCVLTRARVIDKDEIPVQDLNLFYAKRPSDNEYVTISDAVVKVSGPGQTYDFVWNGGKWISTFIPEFGTEYTLDVTLPDGKRLSARTVVPQEMYISGVPVYSGRHCCSSATYYRVEPRDQEAFIWITGAEDRPEIRRFCTNHPGADDSNVVDGVWQDLPIAVSVRDNYNNIFNDTLEEADRDLWMKFGRMCLDLPIHKDYLRIHHPASFDNGITGHLIQNIYHGYSPSADGFILAADSIDAIDPPAGSVGRYTTYRLPIRTYFLSQEYDLYLSKIIDRGFHKDELAAMYSMDQNYTNIEGGLGIFGAMYYSDYVN